MRVLVAVIMFGACAAQQAHAETFYGIEIGGPFAMRLCTLDDLTAPNKVNQGLCTRNDTLSRVEAPWGAITHIVYQTGPAPLATWGFHSYGFTVKEFKGAVVEISVATFGAASQDDALAALTSKFGTPRNVKSTTLQNAFGARITRITAHWRKPGFTVDLEGVGSSIDTGFITIRSDGAAAEEKAAAAWRAINAPTQKM